MLGHQLSRFRIRQRSRLTLSGWSNAQFDSIALGVWDVQEIPRAFIQNGLLFRRAWPVDVDARGLAQNELIEFLTKSLKSAVDIYYPVGGRLKIRHLKQSVQSQNRLINIQIACGSSSRGMPQAGCIYYATTDCAGIYFDIVDCDASVDDIRAIRDPHSTLWVLFPCNGFRGIMGTVNPLLVVCLSFLKDGYFLSWGFNHVVGDATAMCDFIDCWSEIAERGSSSCNMYFKRWAPQQGPPGFEQCRFPFFPHQFIRELLATPLQMLPRPPADLRVAFFHFPYNQVQTLYLEANEQNPESPLDNFGTVGQYESVMARMWKAMVQAYGRCGNETTKYFVPIGFRDYGLRGRLRKGFFANCQDCIAVNETCSFVTQSTLRQLCLRINEIVDPARELRGYSNAFGLGRRPTSVRSGMASKSNGMIVAYEGYEEGDNKGIGLEVCFNDHILTNIIDHDPDFMSYVILDENMNGM